MNQSLFIEKAEKLLQLTEDRASDAGADTDRSGNVLTLESDSGEQVVINIQTPTQQVWLASRQTGGYHFSCAESGEWRDSENRLFQDILAEAWLKVSGDRVNF